MRPVALILALSASAQPTRDAMVVTMQHDASDAGLESSRTATAASSPSRMIWHRAAS